MAALIRETLDETMRTGNTYRLGEARVRYSAVAERPKEAGAMKRIVISLPDDMLQRVRVIGESQGLSMAAYIRQMLDERTRRERPKPSFGAFESGFKDTGELARTMPYEPRTWR